ncbi:MAG: hypothetical protein GQ570_10395 [Helicobacteraceae bacterium]|nr:hypothetical protein [Helicobacteraceae bacterium]
MHEKLENWCERGQACSCFIDGWWSNACKEHDLDYQNQRVKSKIVSDLKLLKNVTFSKWYLVPLSFTIAVPMFLALSFAPKSHKHWERYKKLKGETDV